MCVDPITATAIVAGTAAVGQGYATAMGQKAQNKALRARARLAELNARVNQARASDATLRGHTRALRRAVQAEHAMGATRAGAAAAGVQVDTGSPLVLLQATEHVGQQEVFEETRRAALEAWGYNVEAVNARNRASLYRASTASPWFAASLQTVGSLGQLGFSYLGASGVGKGA